MFVFSLGLILSPRKYASADQIHALFTQVPARPHSSYSKSKKCPSSSDEKGQYVEDINASNNKYGTLQEVFFLNSQYPSFCYKTIDQCKHCFRFIIHVQAL